MRKACPGVSARRALGAGIGLGLAALVQLAAQGNSVGPPQLEAQGTVAFSGISLDQTPVLQTDNVGGSVQSLPINMSDTAFSGQVSSTVNGDFIANYGVLSAWVTATGGEVPGTSQGRAVVVPTVESYTGGSPIADSRDILTITGPTGGSTTVKVVNVLSGSVLTDSYSSASLSANFQTATSPDGANYTAQSLTTLTPGGQMSVEEDLTLNVGDKLVLFSNLYAGGGINANAMPFPPSGLVSSAFSIGNGSSDPAEDTTYISLPAGYGYTAASGATYLSAAPEPASLALLLPLVLVLCLRPRRAVAIRS